MLTFYSCFSTFGFKFDRILAISSLPINQNTLKTLRLLMLIVGFSFQVHGQVFQENNFTPGPKSSKITVRNVNELELLGTIAKSNLVVTHPIHSSHNMPGWGIEEETFRQGELRVFSLSAFDVLQIEYNFRQSGTITVKISDEKERKLVEKEIPHSGIFHLEELDMSLYPAGFYAISIGFVESGSFSGKKVTYTVHKIR